MPEPRGPASAAGRHGVRSGKAPLRASDFPGCQAFQTPQDEIHWALNEDAMSHRTSEALHRVGRDLAERSAGFPDLPADGLMRAALACRRTLRGLRRRAALEAAEGEPRGRGQVGALRRGSVEAAATLAAADGSGRLTVRRSKTDQDGRGAVLYVGLPTMRAVAARARSRRRGRRSAVPVLGANRAAGYHQAFRRGRRVRALAPGRVG